MVIALQEIHQAGRDNIDPTVAPYGILKPGRMSTTLSVRGIATELSLERINLETDDLPMSVEREAL